MKILLMLSLVLSFSVTQANDDRKECYEGEDCLVNQQFQTVTKLIPIEDQQGNQVGVKVNSSSALSDVVTDNSNSCYYGKASNVCEILELLAENENQQYYQGAHSYIEDVDCQVTGSGHLDVTFALLHDWSPHFEILTYNIPMCR